jgi:hypothetical protein
MSFRHPEDLAALLNRVKCAGIHNYATVGLSSHLIPEGAVRLFEAERETTEFITPHSHRFDFVCVVLAGSVTNTTFERLPLHEAEDWVPRKLKGHLGNYKLTEPSHPAQYIRATKTYSRGAFYGMLHNEIHTIHFSKGAKVLFFEGPDVTTETTILEPVSRGKVVETFKVQPWMFSRE